MANKNAAAQVAEETQAEETQAAEGTSENKRPVDNSPAGRLIAHAKAYRSAAKKMGGRGDKIEDAEKDAQAARERIATSTDDPEAMNEAIKDLRKAEGRIARMSGTDTKATDTAVKALNDLIDVAQAELKAIQSE